MYKIVVDAMGGDNGSSIVVDAIKKFLEDNKDVEITVAGKKEELSSLEGKCRILDARDVVPMEAGALEVMRLKNSSMAVAIRTMKEEGLDAVVSCGSTGGFLSAATINLKMIPGVKRAALVAPFPTAIKGKNVVILDIGANNENSPEELVQFALMGKLYSQSVFGVEKPAVYLLNNGVEEGKGAPEVKAAYKLLKAEYENNRLVYENDLTFMLASALWEARSAIDLTKYLSVSETFANAAWTSREKCLSFTDYAMMLKNRSLTYTHVCRALLHIALRIEKDSSDFTPASGTVTEKNSYPDFAHILGMRKEAGSLVSRMMEISRIPLIMRPSRELKSLDGAARSLFYQEMRLSNLYNILASRRSGQNIQNEMSRRLITV